VNELQFDRKATILVVDDSLSVRKVIEKHLLSLQFKVELAVDGLDALEVPAHHSLRVDFTGQLPEYLSADLWNPLWKEMTESLGCRSDMQAWKDEKSTALDDGTGRRCWNVEVPVC